MAEHPSTPAPYVFVSYSSTDRARALALANRLEAAGLAVWLDRHAITGGASWSAAIAEGIRHCTVFAVLCSRAAMGSDNVRRELQLAMEERKPLLPLLLESVEQPAAVRYILAGSQWVELLDRPEDRWMSDVLRALAGLGLPAAERLTEAVAAPPAVPAAPPLHLPTPLTSFIGREHELADLGQALTTSRLVTLTGLGGTGKTRLALEVAGGVAGEVAFVELAPLAEGNLVPQAVAAALGVHEQPPQPLLQTLTAALQRRRLLLVLDNCEHLVGACAALAEALLLACHDVRILATTREPLGIGGEVVWPVPPLSLPDLQVLPAPDQVVASEAVRLFVARAQAALPTFALTARNTRAVVEVCVQLDGLPLAIELAAARVRALAPAQIAARLSDRFRLLAGGSRTAPARHQSLQAAIDWSYDLLSAAERTLLLRLAVFAGGWALEAAEAVCAGEAIAGADVLPLLSQLVDRSLVVAEPDASGALRYRLLESIREYATERLASQGERETLAQRHRAWYLALGEQALEDYWQGVDPPVFWARLAPEQANVRAALRFSLARGEAEPGLRLAAGIWPLWAFRGPWAENWDWIRRFLALPGAADHPAARADALTLAGQLTFELGDVATARLLLLEAVTLQRQLGAVRGLAQALCHAGLVAGARGEFVAAHALFEEAVAIARAAGNRSYEAITLAGWAVAPYLQGDYALTRRLAEESLAILSGLEHHGGSTRVDATIPRYMLGRVALCSAEYTAARRHFEATLALWRETGEARTNPGAGALVGLACVAVAEGEPAEARDYLEEALAFSERQGSGAGLAYALEGSAILAAVEGRSEQAARLAGAAAALRAVLEYRISPAEQSVLERWLGPARGRVGEAAFARAYADGQSLSRAAAVAEARGLVATVDSHTAPP